MAVVEGAIIVESDFPKADIDEYYIEGKSNLRVAREHAMLAARAEWPVTTHERSTLIHFHDAKTPCENIRHEYYPKKSETTS